MMKVYIASSWRNTFQPTVVSVLRSAGHEVYDFKNPEPGNTGFSWRSMSEPWELEDAARFRDHVLQHPVAQAAFALDMDALRGAEATVLVLPCGRSAHLELGWATGSGQRTIVLLDGPVSEPELMYLMNSKICINLAEVVAALE